MRLNAFGRVAVNSPARALVQRRCVAPRLSSLGGHLTGCRVLEIGCGRGIGTQIALEQLGAASVDAFDIDLHMLRRARARTISDPRVRLSQADARAIPVANATFDAAMDFGTLYLIRERGEVLEEIRRVLKPGGRFLFEVPACALTRIRDPLVTASFRPAHTPFGRAFVKEIEAHGFSVRHDRLRLAGTIQLAGDLLGVAIKMPIGVEETIAST